MRPPPGPRHQLQVVTVHRGRPAGRLACQWRRRDLSAARASWPPQSAAAPAPGPAGGPGGGDHAARRLRVGDRRGRHCRGELHCQAALATRVRTRARRTLPGGRRRRPRRRGRAAAGLLAAPATASEEPPARPRPGPGCWAGGLPGAGRPGHISAGTSRWSCRIRARQLEVQFGPTEARAVLSNPLTLVCVCKVDC
jgi:hypothetical protein